MAEQLIVGYDGSDTAATAVRWAAGEAALRRLPVRVLSSYAFRPMYDPSGMASAYVTPEEVEQIKVACVSRAAAIITEVGAEHPDVSFVNEATINDAASALVEAAQPDDLIVVGNSGAGAVKSFLLGSVVSAVLHESHCPVVVVPGRLRDETSWIVVGVDGSAEADAAVLWAADEADRRGARLLVVHAWDYPYPVVSAEGFTSGHDTARIDAALVVERAVEAARERCGVDVDSRVVEGHAVQALLDAGDAADLVVVGSRGRGGFRSMLFGSVARGVCTHATTPTVVIRSSREQ
jgi:nucleotide-binding universal stress UspA family protein